MAPANKSLFIFSSNMKKFIIKSSFFAILLVTPLLFFYLQNAPFIAAYQITNSYSFNEKLKWLTPPKKMEIIAIGSSMSLNNLSSSSIISGFKTEKYINLSSWGLKIKDLELLAPLFAKLYNPTIVICASNIMDFKHPAIQYDIKEIENHILDGGNVYTQLFKKYYYNHTNKNKLNYLNNNIYTSLRFDNYGGVPFDKLNFKVEKFRWGLTHSIEQVDEQNYDALMRLSKFLKKQNILFLVAQTPIRTHLQTHKYKTDINTHIQRVRKIVEQNGGIVVNLANIDLPDQYFADSTHLNDVGATYFTNLLITKYKERFKSSGSL